MSKLQETKSNPAAPGLGELVRGLRLDASLSQAELGGRVGLSHVRIADIERGKHARIRPPTAARLAKAFGCDESAFAAFVSRPARENDELPLLVRGRRVELNLTQEALAEAARVKVTYIQQLERGMFQTMGWLTANALADALKIERETLAKFRQPRQTHTDSTTQLATFVCEKMRALGLVQEDVAKSLGISHQAVQEMFSDGICLHRRTEHARERRKQLAAILGIREDELPLPPPPAKRKPRTTRVRAKTPSAAPMWEIAVEKNPRAAAIGKQTAVLAQYFPNLPTRLPSTESLASPAGTDGLFVIPRWNLLASTYAGAVGVVMDALGKKFGTSFSDARRGTYVRETEQKRLAMERLGRAQNDGDLIVFHARLRGGHRGRTPADTRRRTAGTLEFPLGLYEIGIILLTRDASDSRVDALCLDASGDAVGYDRADLAYVATFAVTPDGAVRCELRQAARAHPRFGTATGYEP